VYCYETIGSGGQVEDEQKEGKEGQVSWQRL